MHRNSTDRRNQAQEHDPDLAAAIAASMSGEEAIQEPVDPRDANHLSLYHYPRISSQQTGYFKVKIPGGGNCGFYAVSLGIIHLLLQNKLALPSKKYDLLIGSIKNNKEGKTRKEIEDRLAFFRTGKNPRKLNPPRLQKCAYYMGLILADIDKGKLNTVEAFKDYILSRLMSEEFENKDYFLESMAIILGPALRDISIFMHNQLKEEKAIENPIDMAVYDGENAPEEQLNLLTAFFQFNLKTFFKTPKTLSFATYSAFEVVEEVTHEIAQIPFPAHDEKKSESPKLLEEKNPFNACDWFEIETNTIPLIHSGDPRSPHWDLLVPLDELKHPFSPFLYFPSKMIQDEVNLAVQTEVQYNSDVKRANRGIPIYAPDSYCLVLRDDQWHFYYVSLEGEHQVIEMSDVTGLQEALTPFTIANMDMVKTDKEVIKAIAAYRKQTVLYSEMKEEKFPHEITDIIQKSKENAAQLNNLLTAVKFLELEAKEILKPESISLMKLKIMKLTTLIKTQAYQLMDGTIDEMEKMKLYIPLATAIDNAMEDQDYVRASLSAPLKNIKECFDTMTVSLKEKREDTEFDESMVFSASASSSSPAPASSHDRDIPSLIQAAKENDIRFLGQNEIKETDLLEEHDGNTALMWAIANNKNTFALKLLQDYPRSEQVHRKSSLPHQNTPLILSISKGYDREDDSGCTQGKIAEKLLELKADPNIKDASGRTALHYACLARDKNSIELLNHYDADWNISDNQGLTPLEHYFLDSDTRCKLLLIATGNLQFGEALTYFNKPCDDALLDSLFKSKKIPAEQSLLPITDIESKQNELNKIILPLYAHAKKIFLENKRYKKDPSISERDWAQFEKGIIEKEAMLSAELPSLLGIEMKSKESVKAAALLKVYLELKNNTAKMIYNDQTKQQAAADKFGSIFDAALKNTTLMSERNPLVKVGIGIANFLSLCALTIPWMINGLFFSRDGMFAHQSTTETLLQEAKDKVIKKNRSP